MIESEIVPIEESIVWVHGFHLNPEQIEEFKKGTLLTKFTLDGGLNWFNMNSGWIDQDKCAYVEFQL